MLTCTLVGAYLFSIVFLMHPISKVWLIIDCLKIFDIHGYCDKIMGINHYFQFWTMCCSLAASSKNSWSYLGQLLPGFPPASASSK